MPTHDNIEDDDGADTLSLLDEILSSLKKNPSDTDILECCGDIRKEIKLIRSYRLQGAQQERVLTEDLHRGTAMLATLKNQRSQVTESREQMRAQQEIVVKDIDSFTNQLRDHIIYNQECAAEYEAATKNRGGFKDSWSKNGLAALQKRQINNGFMEKIGRDGKITLISTDPKKPRVIRHGGDENRRADEEGDDEEMVSEYDEEEEDIQEKTADNGSIHHTMMTLHMSASTVADESIRSDGSL